MNAIIQHYQKIINLIFQENSFIINGKHSIKFT